jgi:hypothetical protein
MIKGKVTIKKFTKNCALKIPCQTCCPTKVVHVGHPNAARGWNRQIMNKYFSKSINDPR